MKHTLAVRRSDMLPVRMFDVLERRVLVPQAVGRLSVLIHCGDGEYVKNSVPWKRISAYTLLSRWIDTNHHMYIKNLAVDERPCPPFYSRFWGVYPFLSSALDYSSTMCFPALRRVCAALAPQRRAETM